MALAAQAMVLCGVQLSGQKRCLACSGECEQCPAPWSPPKFTPAAKPTPAYQGCSTALAKSLPYCDGSKSIDERVRRSLEPPMGTAAVLLVNRAVWRLG